MRSRFRDQLFYAALALGFAAAYSALVTIGVGLGLRARAKERVERARRRVKRAQQRVTSVGADFVRLLRSAV